MLVAEGEGAGWFFGIVAGCWGKSVANAGSLCSGALAYCLIVRVGTRVRDSEEARGKCEKRSVDVKGIVEKSCTGSLQVDAHAVVTCWYEETLLDVSKRG